MALDGRSTLSGIYKPKFCLHNFSSCLFTPVLFTDFALDNIVEDLNNGIEPKTLALAIQALAAKETEIITDKNYKIPLHLFNKGMYKPTHSELKMVKIVP